MSYDIRTTFELFWVMFSSKAASALYHPEYLEGYPNKMLITGQLYLPLFTFLVIFFALLYIYIKFAGNPVVFIFKGFLPWKGQLKYCKSQRSVFTTTFLFFVPLAWFLVVAVETRYRVHFFLDFWHSRHYDLSAILALLFAATYLSYPIFAWFFGVRKLRNNEITDFMHVLFTISDEINKSRELKHPIQMFTWRGLWGKLTRPKQPPSLD